MTPTQHQAFGLLVREMRYIAGISSGQVHRIAMTTLDKVAALSPAHAVSEGDSAPTTVQQAANELIALAYRAGQVVTIERRPLKPLAMGNAEYVVDIRPVRGAS